MDIQSLDFEKLQSYEDRQAVIDAVKSQVQAPLYLIDIHSNVLQRSLKIVQSVSSNKPKSHQKLIEQALTEQFHYEREELQLMFFNKVKQMLSWVRRFHWSEPNDSWVPSDWVKIATVLDIEDQFIQTIIEQSSSLSWKSWHAALSLENNWEKNWLAWERAMVSSPSVAVRWVNALLNAMYSAKTIPTKTINLYLGTTRGNNCFKMFMALENNRSPYVYQELENILSEKINAKLLNGINYSLFFIDENSEICLKLAKRRFQKFLEMFPEDASRWLSGPRLSSIRFDFKNTESNDAQLLKYLKILAVSRQAGHADIKALLLEWEKYSESDSSLWYEVLSEDLYATLAKNKKTNAKEIKHDRQPQKVLNASSSPLKSEKRSNPNEQKLAPRSP